MEAMSLVLKEASLEILDPDGKWKPYDYWDDFGWYPEFASYLIYWN